MHKNENYLPLESAKKPEVRESNGAEVLAVKEVLKQLKEKLNRSFDCWREFKNEIALVMKWSMLDGVRIYFKIDLDLGTSMEFHFIIDL